MLVARSREKTKAADLGLRATCRSTYLAGSAPIVRFEGSGEMRLAGESMTVGNLGDIKPPVLAPVQQKKRTLQALFQNKTMGLCVFQGK